MPVHKTHMHPQSYITLGKHHEAEVCWLNYLMRCNKSWQDQLALESGFSSFYHYIEMWTIVERNVILLCCSSGTQLCSTVLESSPSMECKAWWMLWKVLLMQRSLLLVLFLKFWRCFDLAGHSWFLRSLQHTLAEQSSSTGQWSPEYSQSVTLPVTKHTMTSFPFLISPSPQGHCWLIIATTSCSYFSIFFLKIGVIKYLGHLSIWHGSKAPDVASHIGFLFNGPDLFSWKEICSNSTLFVWGRFCSCQWHPSISFMFPASPLNANQPLKNNCSQTNWMPLDSLEKDCLSFEVYPIMMAGISKSNNCTSLLCDCSIWCVLGSGAWWKETHPVRPSWTPLWMAPNVAQTR